jgi:deoxyribose-phosphate aldolase
MELTSTNISKELDQVLAQAIHADRDVYELVHSLIDMTTLKITDNEQVISDLCESVNSYAEQYPGRANVAAICVYPAQVPRVKRLLRDERVRIASVAGGFPDSQTFLEVKTTEARMAVEAGADEIDIVIPLGEYMAGKTEKLYEEVRLIKQSIGQAHLKVILESGLMEGPQEIFTASEMSIGAGADFIKTSTGKNGAGASLEALYVMAKAVKGHYEKTGQKIGLKPSGGISGPMEAIKYLQVAESVLGKEWMSPALFRFGASRLVDAVREKL